MNRKIRFLAVVLFALFLCSCNKGHDEIISGPYTPAISSPVKVRVTDVWNDTHQVFDVDIIGLLWSGLEESLKKRGMLWSPDMGDHYLILEAHVLDYKKGSMAGRLVPYAGDAVLSVRCTLRDGSRELATIESKRKFSFGNGTFTRSAWRQVFWDVSEDVTAQAVRKF